jgi:hypothetical protein
MGIYGNRFYFRQGLPKISKVQEKFKDITGLSLGFTSDIYLKEIVDNRDDIIYQLNNSQDKPGISTPYFSCSGFDDAGMADYSVEENSFQIEYGSKNLYFFYALIKTMYELGGLHFRHYTYPAEKGINIEDHLEPYNPYDREWKRIKKWDEMSEMEKDSFKERYA